MSTGCLRIVRREHQPAELSPEPQVQFRERVLASLDERDRLRRRVARALAVGASAMVLAGLFLIVARRV